MEKKKNMPGPTQRVSGGPGSNPRPNYSKKFCTISDLFLWYCMTLYHFSMVFGEKHTSVTNIAARSREKKVLETTGQSTALPCPSLHS